MAIVNQANLRKYLNQGYNVLFKGEHGIGKTAIIKECFETAGLKWAYFSASTLDPWTDLIGVPKEIPNPKEPGTNILGFIRPEIFQNDQIEAIFFDELNRANPKVLNAIMELIQFKSINGFKLKNLKVVWAAINPDDAKGTYSVEYLDPAQIDRFHVQLDIKTDVDADFFKKKYPHISAPLIQWWREMPADIQKEVSPRRLDYIGDALMNQCRIEDFVVGKANVGKLRSLIGDTVSVLARLEKALQDEKAGLALLADANAMLRLARISAEGVEALNKKYAGKVSAELTSALLTTASTMTSGPKWGSVETVERAIAQQLARPEDGWFRTLPRILHEINSSDPWVYQKIIEKLSGDGQDAVISGLSSALARMKGDSLTMYFQPGSPCCLVIAYFYNQLNKSFSQSRLDRFKNLTGNDLTF